MLKLGSWMITTAVDWRKWRLGFSVEDHLFMRFRDMQVGPLSIKGTWMDPEFVQRAGERILERLHREAESL